MVTNAHFFNRHTLNGFFVVGINMVNQKKCMGQTVQFRILNTKPLHDERKRDVTMSEKYGFQLTVSSLLLSKTGIGLKHFLLIMLGMVTL